MGTHDIWVGAVSDSEYMERSGVLTLHQKFVEKCGSHSSIPFTILLDKGYRINTIAWRTGGQFILQPHFSRSDQRFTGHETIRMAAIASDRAANERAVRYSKMCGYIRLSSILRS
jgi:hypothetical protein